MQSKGFVSRVVLLIVLLLAAAVGPVIANGADEA